MVRQQTLKHEISVTGVGVHKAKKVFLTLRPAPPDTGIIFRCVGKDPVVEIPAIADHVSDTFLSTTLKKEGVSISTVEHLLSALAGVGIDNILVDISTENNKTNQYEIPILDGSAMPFVILIRGAKIAQQEALKKFMRIKKTVEVRTECVNGGKPGFAKLTPFPGFKVSFTIDFKHPVFGGREQSATLNFSGSSYVKEVSRARTFGFLKDCEKLRQNDLVLGSSLDNTVVLDEFKVMNEEGMRYPDEPVRHKMLDAIGDLHLLGHNLIGSFEGYKSGHTLNNRLVNAVLADQEAYDIVTFEDEKALPVSFMRWVFAESKT